MGSGRAKIRRILEWRILSRWREINTQVFCEPGLVNQQHHFAVWRFGHCKDFISEVIDTC